MENNSHQPDVQSAQERLKRLAEEAESREFLRSSLDDADRDRTRPLRQLIESLGTKRG
jgi:hypothetical protein